MARQPVEQVQCDRCKRVELRPTAATPKDRPDFQAVFMDKMLKYDDLCGYCNAAIAATWKELEQWRRELPQKLLGDQAAPLATPNDNSPPKPHSPAGAKR